MKYFISDFHFGHNSIIGFEREEFSSIEEHDKFIISLMKEWANTLKEGDVWYNLGDWGDIDKLWCVNLLREKGIKTVFVRGNHDRIEMIEEAKKYFDEVYMYPFYLDNNTIVSHIPESVFPDQLNICGHIHNGNLNSPNYLCCSLKVANYKLISEKQVKSKVDKLPKRNRYFLWEPFAKFYNFKGSDRKDLVFDPCSGDIDLPASRALQKIIRNSREK